MELPFTIVILNGGRGENKGLNRKKINGLFRCFYLFFRERDGGKGRGK